MPSLSDLQKFKSSFHNIGGQKADLVARNLPFDDLELPDSEPKPEIYDDETGAGASPGKTTPSGAEAATDSADDFDFSTLIGTQLGDPPPPPMDDDTESVIGKKSDAEQDAGAAEEFYTPAELLSNFSEEIEAIPPDFPAEEDPGEDFAEVLFEDDDKDPDPLEPNLGDEPFNDFIEGESPDIEGLDDPGESGLGEADSGDFDLDDLGDFGLSDEPLMADESGLGKAESDGLDLDDLGDFGLSDEPLMAEGADFNLDDLDDLNLSDEPLLADGMDSDLDGAEGGDFNLDDLGDLGLSDEPLLADGVDSDFGDAEGADFNLDDLGDLGLSDEPLLADGTDSSFDEAEGGDFNLDDLGDLGLSDEPLLADGVDSELDAAEGGDFNLDDLGDLGLSDEPLLADGVDSDFGDAEGADFNLDDLSDLGISDEPLLADGVDSDFGDAEGGDFSLDDLSDLGISDEPLLADGTDSSFDEAEGGDFSLDDLGDLGLSDEPLLADGADSGFDEAEGGDFSLDDLGDLGLSDEPILADGADSGFDEAEGGDFNLDDFGDLGISDEPLLADGADSGFGEAEGADFNLDALGLSDEPLVADGADSEFDDAEGADFNLDALSDLGLSDEPPTADDPAVSIDEPEKADFDIDSLGDLSFSDQPDEPADDTDDALEHPAFANGSFGTGDETAGDADHEILGMDDFSFPDLDKALEKVKTSMVAPQPEAPPTPAKTGFWGKSKSADMPPAPDNLEDIRISEAEFRDLQETLANYPLNLRIACQEIIVEQDINPGKMMMLIRNLVQGAPAKETAALASEILGRTITIPKRFEKSSGEALAAEQATFSYIFLNNFLPVFRIVALIALLAASVFYLAFRFVYVPLRAESIYRSGYERLHAGDFRRANDLFAEAFGIHRNINWFYRYAEGFIYHRQFALAEQKYETLLRYFPRDRRGVLDFARFQTNQMRNYPRADHLLRRYILDFNPNDFDALLAAGDNSLAWGEIDPARFEDARISFARLLDIHGWTPPVAERMLRFFIRTDNLREVLNLRNWFDAHPRRTMGAETLAELGGYLLDKQFEETRGVPNEFRGQIRGVPDILLEAASLDPSLPEPYYHLSRFYHSIGRNVEERATLERAIRAFDNTREESVRRLRYRIDAHQRYADALINDMEFFPAEEQLIRGISLYEDAMRRRLQTFLTPSPMYGRLFAGLGDLTYFSPAGDMEAALNFYRMAERHGWATPEMLFRMGAAYYRLENWGNAMEYLFVAASDLPQNRRILFALGNAALKRGDFFAAQGFYNRLLDILENQRSRLPVLLPNDRPEYLELAERLMMARNNAGVASEMLAAQTGDLSHRTRALALYAEAQRAWDARTRDPATMIRSGSVPLPHLNMRNALHPEPGFEPQIFIRIDRDALETSPWERLAPQMTW